MIRLSKLPPKAVIFGVLLALFPALAFAAGGWDRFWQELSSSTYIQVGSGKEVVYEFFDPNCPYCGQAMETEAPFISSGKLTVRYIPVPALEASSMGKAAAILESQNPQAALVEDLRGALHTGAGGIAGVMPTQAVRASLERNLGLLRQTGMDIVPDLVFRLPDGHVGLIKGIFPDFALTRIIQGREP